VLLRQGKALVPDPGTTLRAEDVLVVVAQDEARLAALRKLIHPEAS
jgi:K+/H+ antiporter YhaU regulatory subunit KhtT